MSNGFCCQHKYLRPNVSLTKMLHNNSLKVDSWGTSAYVPRQGLNIILVLQRLKYCRIMPTWMFLKNFLDWNRRQNNKIIQMNWIWVATFEKIMAGETKNYSLTINNEKPAYFCFLIWTRFKPIFWVSISQS